MIRVLIADDEERVCRLIQALVDWESLGMQVIGMVANGIEALEWIKKENPDILITDIRMPGCNGLELISKVRELCSNINIIIISGYAHFEYARTAIQYNVGNYLLKPINKEELIEALVRIKRVIEEEQRLQEESDSMKRKRENDVIKLRSMFIQDVLEKHQLLLTEEMMRTHYHLKVQKGYYQCFCLKFDLNGSGKAGEIEEEAQKIIMDKLTKLLESSLNTYCYEWVVMPKYTQIYGMCNYATKYKGEVRKILRRCLCQLEAQKNLLGDVEITLGLGRSVKAIEGVEESFIEAEKAMKERLIEGTGKLIEYKELNAVLYEKRLLDKYARSMNHALETLNSEELRGAIDALRQDVLDTDYIHGWEILELVIAAGEMFAMRLGMHMQSEEMIALKKQCHESKSIQILFECLKQFVGTHIEQVVDEREKDSVRTIRLAKQYMQNHYIEQITLEQVSEYVGLSPSYFSALFKKESEVGFAKYLMKIRMEQAKTMLRDTHLSVGDICLKVGYNDKKHFTQSFEKLTGVKPAVYRKLYG